MSNAKTTLLVDDNNELRDATREHLEEQGYQVTAAAGAEQALREAEAAIGDFELLVSDVYMSGMTGIELADRLLAGDRNLAVLLISSRGGEPEIRRRLAAGDIAFLAKPFSPGELAASAEEAFDRVDRRDRSSPRDVGSAQAAEPWPGAASSRSGMPGWAIQLSAALVLVLGVGMALRSLEVGAPPLPAPVAGDVRRSATIEAVAPLGPLAEAPAEFSWQPIAGAGSYALSLRTIDGNALWQAEVAGPPADLPPEVEESLHRAVTYYWSVEALDVEGRPLARSELAPFVIELARRSP